MKKTTLDIRIDKAGIIQQSRVYTDPKRVIAEFVDNAIDAAEDFYNGVVYLHDIEINVTKNQGGKISIRDNASGMLINPDSAYTIFKSLKSDDPKTNGMFGFGMFSFMSICNRLEIETWHRSSSKYAKLAFTTDLFSQSSYKEPSVELVTEEFYDKMLGGTVITLSEFYEGQFEDISMMTLKEEFERHFELILQRPGISISLRDESGCVLNCSPFDYDLYCRAPYNRTIHSLHKTHSKKHKTVKDFDVSSTPARIHLALSETKEFNRPVFFAVKGRRVADVSSIDQFGTKRKYQIWSRSNLTGFIDVTGILTPVISRNDFVQNELSKAFFQTLLSYEDEIVNYIESNSPKDSGENLRKIESEISEALKELELEEISKGRLKGKSPGKRIYTIKGIERNDAVRICNSKGRSMLTAESPGTTGRSLDRRTIHELEFLNRTMNSETGPDHLRVRIDTSNEPSTDLNGNQLRSVLRGSTVCIFGKHEDFQARKKSSPKGHEEVTQRLISYIAMEASSHYIYRKSNQTDFNSKEDRLKQFVSTVLKLENKLRILEGQSYNARNI